jgi:hypothetical protein
MFSFPKKETIGYVTLALKTSAELADLRESVLVVLGVMHFGNLYIFSRMRRRARPAAQGG